MFFFLPHSILLRMGKISTIYIYSTSGDCGNFRGEGREIKGGGGGGRERDRERDKKK